MVHKKILGIVLSAAMILGGMNLPAYATDAKKSEITSTVTETEADLITEQGETACVPVHETVDVAGESEAEGASVAGESEVDGAYVEEGTKSFLGSSLPYPVSDYGTNGIKLAGFSRNSGGHGTEGAGTITINLEKSAKVIVEGCMYRNGSNLVSASSGGNTVALTTSEYTSGAIRTGDTQNGNITPYNYTFSTVPAGEVVISVKSGEYIHGVIIKYLSDGAYTGSDGCTVTSELYVDGAKRGDFSALNGTRFTYTKLDDNFAKTSTSYQYTVTGGVLSALLPAGQWKVEADLVPEGYAMRAVADVKIASGATSAASRIDFRTVLTSVTYKEEITVGGAGADYATVSKAIEAVKAMKRTDPKSQPVTVRIQPGDYHEMPVIDVPYVKFVNASANPSIALKNKGVEADANAVRITSHYGHGYSYYSMGEDYKYDSLLGEVNRANGYVSVVNPGSGSTTYWNATVVVKASDVSFENIIFENSFNQYVASEAVTDGQLYTYVKNNQFTLNSDGATKQYKEGSVKRADMEAGSTQVQEKAYVERAAALAIAGGTQISFDHCKFVGRQDTLYGNNGSTAAFYNCDVYGAVDYIFGGMTAVFAKCNLVANTSADKNDTFYITAPYHKSGEKGYLMYNCNVVSTSPGVDTASTAVSKQGCFGRPWQANTSEAVFLATNLASTKTKIGASAPGDADLSIIADEGWKAWNSDGSGHTDYFYEIGSYESKDSLVKTARTGQPDWVNAYQVLSGAKAVVGSGEAKSLTAYTSSDKGAPGVFLDLSGDWDPFAGKNMAIEQKAVSTTSNEVSDVAIGFTKEGGWFESIYAEISGIKADKVTKVEYSDAEDTEAAATALSSEDMKFLVRAKNSNTVRIDIPGVKPGKYKLKVTAEGKIITSDTIIVKAYDRAGFAHFKTTGGVGAYNNDGTLKENARVVYVNDENKNSVTLTYGSKTYTGVAGILGSSTLLKALAADGVPLDVRFVGIVSDSGLYEKAPYDPSAAGLISGLSSFSTSAKDNGHMLSIKQGRDITIEGIGTDAVIDGWGFSFSSGSATDGKSFEARNLTFINTAEDAIGMEGQQTGSGKDATLDKPVEHCWIHNNEFYRPNLTKMADEKDHDKYEGDGTVDFKRGQYLTVAYNYFDDCHKTSLIGGGDDHLQFNLTYHHNYWNKCYARIPMARWANIHLYNNIIDYQSGTGMNSRYASYMFSERNLFYMANNPMKVDNPDDGTRGAIKSYMDSVLGRGTNNGKVVTDKAASVENDCKYVVGGVDYSSFDTSAELSYITDETNYNPTEDFITLRKTIAAYCGVMDENPREPVEIGRDEYSVITGKNRVHDGTVNEIKEDDFSNASITTSTAAGYAFRIFKESDVTIAASDASVLVNDAGEVLLDGDGTKRVPAGVYLIQSADFTPGSYGAGGENKASAGASTAAAFEPLTISSLAIKAAPGAKAYYPLQLDYNYNSAPAALEFEIESGTAFASLEALLEGRGFVRTGYELLGLYTDEACTTVVTYPLTITDQTTLYAKWKNTATNVEEDPDIDDSSSSNSSSTGGDDSSSSSSATGDDDSSSSSSAAGGDDSSSSSSASSGEGKDSSSSSSGDERKSSSSSSDGSSSSGSSSAKSTGDSSSGKSGDSSSQGSGDKDGGSSSAAPHNPDEPIIGGNDEEVGEQIIEIHKSGNIATKYEDKESGKAADGSEFTIDIVIDNNTYDGTKKKPEITLYDKDNNKLVLGKDYKVAYKNNKNANMTYNPEGKKFNPVGGTKQPTFIVKFKGAYKGAKTLSGTFNIYPFPISYAMITPKADTINAKTGRSFKFIKAVTAQMGGKTRKLNQMKDMDPLKTKITNTETGESYTMADNANAPAGTYMIEIEGAGNFYHYKKDGQFKLNRQ